MMEAGDVALRAEEFQKLLRIVTQLRSVGALESSKGRASLPRLAEEGLAGPFWSWPQDAQGLDTSSDVAWCRELLQRKLLLDAGNVRRHLTDMRSLILQSRTRAVKNMERAGGTVFEEERVSSTVRSFTSIQVLTQQLHSLALDNYKRAAAILYDFDVVLSSPPGTLSMVSTATVLPLIINMFGLAFEEGPGFQALQPQEAPPKISTRATRRTARVTSKERAVRASKRLTIHGFKALASPDFLSSLTPAAEVIEILQLGAEAAPTAPKTSADDVEELVYFSESDEEDSVPEVPVPMAERCLSVCRRMLILPIFTAVRELKYDQYSFRADLMASLIISAAGIPKAMSYAALTGLPVAAGIVTMYVPCVVYALLGHSRQGAVSPQSVPCLLLAALVEEEIQKSGLEADGGERAALTMLFTLITGVVIMVMGLLQMSVLLQFISKPVLSGFVSASSLIAAASTAKSLLGIKLKKSPLLHETLAYIVQGLPSIHWATTAVSVSFILLYLLHGRLKKFAKPRAKRGWGWKACFRALEVPAVVPVVLFGAFLGACLCDFQPFTKWVLEHVVLGCGSSSMSLIFDSAGRSFNDSKYQAREAAVFSASGSGEGLRQVMHEGPWVDFGSSDVRPSDAELQRANVSATFPVASTWICPVANVPPLRGSHQISLILDLPLLAAIFEGNATDWADPRIQQLNPNLPWAGVSQRITVVTRSGSSGTTHNFAQGLSAASPAISPGMSVAWGAPSQLQARSNADVVKTVASTDWAIGYATVGEVDAGDSRATCVAVSMPQGIFTVQQAKNSGGALPWPFQQTAHVLVPTAPVVARAGLPRRSFCAARRALHEYLERVFRENGTAVSVNMQLMPRPPDLDTILCPGGRRLAGSAKASAKCSGIKMVGHVEPSLPSFSVPSAKTSLDMAGVVTKCTMLAVVILLEHVAIVKHYSEKHGYSVPISADLMAVGLANIVGAFSGSFIVACGLSRSALNASAVSQISLLLSAIVSLAIVYAVAPVISMLPDPVLGVVLFMAVIHMVDVRMVLRLARLRLRGVMDLVAVTVAFVATCVLGVVNGMITAVAFSLVVFIFNSTYPQISELRRKEGSAMFFRAKSYDGFAEVMDRLFGRKEEPLESGAVLVLRFEAPLWFANVGRLRDVVVPKLMHGSLRTLVLDMSTVPWMDASAAVEFDKLLLAARDNAIEVCLVAVGPVVQDMLTGTCGEEVLDLFFDSLYEAQLEKKRRTAWGL